MNKAYLEDNPNLAVEYHEKPMHMASEDDPHRVPLCGHEEHLWTTTEAKYVDCPDCLEKMEK